MRYQFYLDPGNAPTLRFRLLDGGYTDAGLSNEEVERSAMPDADVIRKNLAQSLQDCAELCRVSWESMLDSADPGSLGTDRFTPQELKTLSENTIRAQEAHRVCQQLLNRRMSPAASLRATLNAITDTDPQQLVETDSQKTAQQLQTIEAGIKTLERVRTAQQKVSN